MIVMVLQNVPTSVRGELSRWMLEPYPGVFIGNLSAMVRDRLWKKACQSCRDGGVFQAWSCDSEQRFRMRVHGRVRRSITWVEGVQLVIRPPEP